tara:strand:- start:84 stop:371 length:288 start_codon:yes stop_codon:yes gene_type:complete
MAVFLTAIFYNIERNMNKMFYYLALETYNDNDNFEPTTTTKNVVIKSKKKLPDSLHFVDQDDSLAYTDYQLISVNKKEYDVLKKFFKNNKYEVML